MGCGSIRIPKWIKLVGIFLITGVIIACFGCTPLETFLIRFIPSDPMSGNYPYSPTESEWVCENPQFTLRYYRGQDGLLSMVDETLEWNGSTLEVRVGYRSNSFWVYPQNSNRYEDMLFCGNWKYDKEGNLVFKLTEDFFFENQYSKLIFKRVK